MERSAMAKIVRRTLPRGPLDNCLLTAVGVLFIAAATRRRLFLMRADKKYRFTWGLVGGKIESNETLKDAIHRESVEEIGAMPEYHKLIPVEQFTSPDNKFLFHTFICVVDQEFVPVLNHEHIGYAWCDPGVWPKPMHPGLWATVNIHEVQDKIDTIETVYMSQCDIKSR